VSGAHDNGTTPRKRKLIEVALPLEAISKASKADKDRKVGTIKNIHKWFAPMPAPAWRALLFAATIDDPGDAARRAELLEIIEGLVPDNGTAPSEEAFKKARAALAEQGGELPTILDPFCGGGSTLVEAQRLGFSTVASDLNPVPALVTRIETQLVPSVVGKPPVTGPGQGMEGIADDPLAGFLADVEHYARMVERQVREQVGHLYEAVDDGEVVAWLWARTVPCANPACAIPLPLYSSPWLSKQKNREAWLKPIVDGKEIRFDIGTGKADKIPEATKRGGRGKFTCPACATDVDEKYLRKAGAAGHLGLQMLAIAVEDSSGRRFVPEPRTVGTGGIDLPDEVPELDFFAANTKQFSPPLYGLRRQADIYTPRQLHTLGAFADAVAEVPERVRRDGGDEEQAVAIASVLAICVSKLAMANSSQTRWKLDSKTGTTKIQPGFGRQAIPMLWDFAEVNPFSGAGGSWRGQINTVISGLKALPRASRPGVVWQVDARKAGSLVSAGSALVATDPPYFAQIPYADLSDYFYVWLRRAAAGVHPDLFGTMATPKTDELVANRYRHGGVERARQYFIDGFVDVFSSLKGASRSDLPMIVIYAHRQEEGKDNEMASSAWDALLEAMIAAGIGVVGTWPLHATNSTRQVGQGANALASYVVMICRPREATASSVDRRGFISALREELPGALRDLQQSSIPAVDLAQAAIGPGMAVFSRHAKVTEPDGSAMRVRDALVLINDELARVLSEQEGDFDTDTRWCVRWFEQYQWAQGPFGEAELLANALNTSLHGLEDAGVVKARAGKALMFRPEELDASYDPAADHRISVWEVAMHLSRVLEGKGAGSGVDAAGALLARARARIDEDAIKELAYLLYNICERKGWSDSARRFNNLVSSWPDLQTAARSAARQGTAPMQASLVFGAGSESDEEEDLLF
jgi:putative DNA methylase